MILAKKLNLSDATYEERAASSISTTGEPECIVISSGDGIAYDVPAGGTLYTQYWNIPSVGIRINASTVADRLVNIPSGLSIKDIDVIENLSYNSQSKEIIEYTCDIHVNFSNATESTLRLLDVQFSSGTADTVTGCVSKVEPEEMAIKACISGFLTSWTNVTVNRAGSASDYDPPFITGDYPLDSNSIASVSGRSIKFYFTFYRNDSSSSYYNGGFWCVAACDLMYDDGTSIVPLNDTKYVKAEGTNLTKLIINNTTGGNSNGDDNNDYIRW